MPLYGRLVPGGLCFLTMASPSFRLFMGTWSYLKCLTFSSPAQHCAKTQSFHPLAILCSFILSWCANLSHSSHSPLLIIVGTRMMASDVTTVLCDVTVPSLLSHIHDFTVNCILGSRASSTMIRYDSHWERFKLWCSSVNVSYQPNPFTSLCTFPPSFTMPVKTIFLLPQTKQPAQQFSCSWLGKPFWRHG